MSHIKIVQAGDHRQVEIDGRPVKDVTRVQMDFPVDDLAQVHLGVAVTQPFEFEGDASVHMHLHVPEGCKLIDVSTFDSLGDRKKWIVTKVVPVILLCLLAAPAFAQGVIRVTPIKPLTPNQAADILRPNQTQLPPAIPDGPTVTFTGATSPSLGPWDNLAVRSSIYYGYQVTADRVHSRYTRGRHLPLRAWQSQDRLGRVHVLTPSGFARQRNTRHQSDAAKRRSSSDQSLGINRPTSRQRHLPRIERRVPQDLLRGQTSHGVWPSVRDVEGERSQRRPTDPGRREATAPARQR